MSQSLKGSAGRLGWADHLTRGVAPVVFFFSLWFFHLSALFLEIIVFLVPSSRAAYTGSLGRFISRAVVLDFLVIPNCCVTAWSGAIMGCR